MTLGRDDGMGDAKIGRPGGKIGKPGRSGRKIGKIGGLGRF
jgi:hypothetical protein